MSTPDSNQNEPSKMRKLLSGGDSDESPMSRLPRGAGGVTTPKVVAEPASAPKAATPKKSLTLFKSKPKSAPKKVEVKQKPASQAGFQTDNKFLPAFWTIASAMSFAVNVVVLIVLAIVLYNLNSVGVTVTNLTDHLLGGLYTNFVKMDEAHIKTNIPVSKEIPVQFTLNVSGPTSVTLSQDVAISGALVTVNTGGLNINNARANIVLPEGTVLPIFIQNLVVPVDQKVLAELDVAVDIPLNQTELHEPFVGLRNVVEPFYCLLNPCQ